MTATIGSIARFDSACAIACPHELAAGVLVGELLTRDGPHPPLPITAPLRREPRPLRRAG
jgi:hypothetical protein